MASPEIQELFASVGLDRPPTARKASVLLTADYQLACWRLANFQRQYHVEKAIDLADLACTLANARVDQQQIDAIWHDLAEWQELERTVAFLYQQLNSH